MTRIIAGTYGGRSLRTLPGDGTRPTTDRTREALFSSLESSFGGLNDLRVLDLFAGSGTIGLEAASRGAVHIDLVEQDRRAADVIRANVAELDCHVAHVRTQPAERFVQTVPVVPYDVIFVDPPYAYPHDDLAALLVAMGNTSWLSADGLIVVERAKRDRFVWPQPLVAVREKRYGETILWYGH